MKKSKWLRHRSFFILLLIDGLFIFLIGFLGYKIYRIKSKVLGTQIIKINKDDIQFASEDAALKYFYEPKPNTTETDHEPFLDHEVKYTINSDSLHERYDYTYTKENNTYRIIMLGDSITFGQNVDTKKNYTEQLEYMLNKKIKCDTIDTFEVINLGVPGYDVDYETARYVKRGVKYNPDLVIWLLNNWNFSRVNELTIPEVKKLVNEGVMSDYDPVSGTYPAMNKAMMNLVNELNTNTEMNYARNALDRVKSIFPKDLIILNFDNMGIDYKKLIYNMFQKPDRNLSFQYIDYLYSYMGSGKYLTKDRVHPNESGHQKIAQSLYEILLHDQFKNCRIK